MLKGIYSILILSAICLVSISLHACGNSRGKTAEDSSVSDCKTVSNEMIGGNSETGSNANSSENNMENDNENNGNNANNENNADTGSLNKSKSTQATKAKRYKAVVKETLPHDKHSYTQGLFFHNGNLYESNGQYGTSNVQMVDIKSGKSTKKRNIDSKYFAEGSCIINNNLYVLTWRENICFVYNPDTFDKIGELKYNGEGWGLTTDGKNLIMSNGTSEIFYLDPLTFTQKRRIEVSLNGTPLHYVNELEYINGEIWANIYGEDIIAAIDPDSGNITKIIDCSNVYPNSVRSRNADVLNGIAYNSSNGYIYITGKLWPHLYRIEIIEIR